MVHTGKGLKRLLAGGLLFTLLAGCGGGGGGGSSSPVAPSSNSSTVDVTGTWTGQFSITDGSTSSNLTLKLFQFNDMPTIGNMVGGTATFSDGKINQLINGSIDGNSINFQIPDNYTQCGSRTVAVTGTVSGNTMSLTFSATAAGGCPAINNVQRTFKKQ